jgi:hypothetical protein
MFEKGLTSFQNRLTCQSCRPSEHPPRPERTPAGGHASQTISAPTPAACPRRLRPLFHPPVQCHRWTLCVSSMGNCGLLQSAHIQPGVERGIIFVVSTFSCRVYLLGKLTGASAEAASSGVLAGSQNCLLRYAMCTAGKAVRSHHACQRLSPSHPR